MFIWVIFRLKNLTIIDRHKLSFPTDVSTKASPNTLPPTRPLVNTQLTRRRRHTYLHTLFVSKGVFGIKIGTVYNSIHQCTKKGMICQDITSLFLCLQTATYEKPILIVF